MDDRLTEAFESYDENGPDENENQDDVRYGLTALGTSHLEQRRSFLGFGPCAAMRPSEATANTSATPRRTIGRARAGRPTSLFG